MRQINRSKGRRLPPITIFSRHSAYMLTASGWPWRWCCSGTSSNIPSHPCRRRRRRPQRRGWRERSSSGPYLEERKIVSDARSSLDRGHCLVTIYSHFNVVTAKTNGCNMFIVLPYNGPIKRTAKFNPHRQRSTISDTDSGVKRIGHRSTNILSQWKGDHSTYKYSTKQYTNSCINFFFSFFSIYGSGCSTLQHFLSKMLHQRHCNNQSF